MLAVLLLFLTVIRIKILFAFFMLGALALVGWTLILSADERGFIESEANPEIRAIYK